MPVVTCCRDCTEEMIFQADWRKRPELRQHYRRSNGEGMCNTCYIRAWRHGTLPDPAPRAQSTRAGSLTCWVVRTYVARCAEHGEIGSGDTRAEADELVARHAEAQHDGSVRNSSSPTPLPAATLARLRAAVGVEVAS